MASPDLSTSQALLLALASSSAQGMEFVSSTRLAALTGASTAGVKRALSELVATGQVEVTGRARATRYRLVAVDRGPRYGVRTQAVEATAASGIEPLSPRPDWTSASLELRRRLQAPLVTRRPVTYRRDFVDLYRPNEIFLLPPKLAAEFAALGRLPEQMPAGTYARKVLEQLLIDLSWSSSRLEGNRYTLLDTERLFRSGRTATDTDSVMLLNHKAAIEFLVDAVPTQGLHAGILRNMHAVLMQDLLMDVSALGAIREKVVNISGTTYVPMQAPAVLHEMFGLVIEKSKQVRNPVEAAFFLWVQLAYLQPFEDGNKRVSRLAANVPLMLHNQSPLSFLDVDRDDYALAMMGVYEFCDVSLAVDLFEWTYRRSHARYRVLLESMGAPDPFRVRHREALNEAVCAIVRDGKRAPAVVASLALPAADASGFAALLEQELGALADYNCARYRLTMKETQAWIDSGRVR
ncbi:Fic family protein [Ramlibacter sp.]|uniref:Fic family protein n=1 Tax=Ramlibacter sp. TaxID=1917967 RepID=UPI003D0A1924